MFGWGLLLLILAKRAWAPSFVAAARDSADTHKTARDGTNKAALLATNRAQGVSTYHLQRPDQV